MLTHRRYRRCVDILLWLSALATAGASQVPPPYEPPPEELPRVVAPQPVPFDHRLHMEQRMACLDCHGGALEHERAGLPDRDHCMLCHQAVAREHSAVREMAAMPTGSKIPWERVYRVPDFVFFSHAEHARAGVDCGSCHGPVETRVVLDQEFSTNMVACMNCHAQRQASNECYLCHDLGQ